MGDFDKSVECRGTGRGILRDPVKLNRGNS